MRIHVWGINYSPEVTGIGPYNTALCEFLLGMGHAVRMITSFMYYPAWEKLPTERKLLFRSDEIDGVPVHRCWHYVPKKVTPFRRIVHELSFVGTSFFRQLFLPRPDLLVVVSPPLLLGAAAWLLSRIRKTDFVFHVQDLQPDAAEGLGMLKDGKLLRILRWLETFAYRKAGLVSGITPGMIQSFQDKGVPAGKCVYFPNGVRIPDFWRLPETGLWRRANGYGKDDFLVVYSGNIGRKQGLDTLLKAMTLVRDPKVKLVLCGEGADLGHLRKRVEELKIQNAQFFSLQAESRYRELLVDADLSVIPQKPGSGSCFFPSKLLPTLAYSSPVLAITDPDTELARAVADGGFGQMVSPLDAGEIAAIIEKAAADPLESRQMGRAGFKFVKRFELNVVLAEFCAKLANFMSEKRNAAGGKPAAREQGQKPTADSY